MSGEQSAENTERKKFRITKGEGLTNANLGFLGEEIDAFWTFGPGVTEVIVEADEGFGEAVREESEYPGLIVEEVDEDGC